MVDEFNKNYGQNKRIKVKLPQEGMEFNEDAFISIEECTKPAAKREIVATEEDWQKIRETKIEDIVSPLHNLSSEEQIATKVKDLNRVIENYNRQFFKDAEVLKRISKGGE